MANLRGKIIIVALLRAYPIIQKIVALISVALLLMQAAKPTLLRAASLEKTANTQYIASNQAVIEDLQEPLPMLAPNVQEVLLDVCQARGYGEDCGKTLLGMLWKESLNNPKAIGDRGKSRGYFQIQTRLHKVPLECAEDLRCSAEWSLDYLESHGYPKFARYAVQCHNGCNAGNGYAASVFRHGNRLWNKPLPITAMGTAKTELALR